MKFCNTNSIKHFLFISLLCANVVLSPIQPLAFFPFAITVWYLMFFFLTLIIINEKIFILDIINAIYIFSTVILMVWTLSSKK